MERAHLASNLHHLGPMAFASLKSTCTLGHVDGYCAVMLVCSQHSTKHGGGATAGEMATQAVSLLKYQEYELCSMPEQSTLSMQLV